MSGFVPAFRCKLTNAERTTIMTKIRERLLINSNALNQEINPEGSSEMKSSLWRPTDQSSQSSQSSTSRPNSGTATPDGQLSGRISPLNQSSSHTPGENNSTVVSEMSNFLNSQQASSMNIQQLDSKYCPSELKDTKIFNAINVILLEKTLWSVDTRISLARMGIDMIGTFYFILCFLYTLFLFIFIFTISLPFCVNYICF